MKGDPGEMVIIYSAILYLICCMNSTSHYQLTHSDAHILQFFTVLNTKISGRVYGVS